MKAIQFIRTAKIGKLSVKGNDYPQLRLLQQFVDTIGQRANVFETEHEGKQAFLIVTEHIVPKENMVLKPGLKLTTDARLAAFELEIKELKLFIFDYKVKKETHFTKVRQSKAEGEIRTRFVASTGSRPPSVGSSSPQASAAGR